MKLRYGIALAAALLVNGWSHAQAPIVGADTPPPRALGQGLPSANTPGTVVQDPRGAVSSSPAAASMPDPLAPPPPNGSGLMSSALDAVTPPAHHRFFVSADYILWRINATSLPAIEPNIPIGVVKVNAQTFNQTLQADGTFSPFTLTSSIPSIFAAQVATTPGIPVGGENTGAHSGFRIAPGCWLTDDESFGLETKFFYLQQAHTAFNVSAINLNTQGIITTPFHDTYTQTIPGAPGSGTTPATPPTVMVVQTIPIAFVRQNTTEMTGLTSNEMWGGELNARSASLYFGPFTLGGVAGFRYLQYHENLDLTGDFSLFKPANVPGGDPAGSNLPLSVQLQTRDAIQARDYFYGGQAGFDLTGSFGGLWIDVLGKLGLGDMHQVADALSSTTQTTFPAGGGASTVTTTSGGLLTTPGTSGHYTHDSLSVVSELNVKVGYQVTDWLLGYVGYDLMGVTGVARTGDLSVPSATTNTVSLGGSSTPQNVQSVQQSSLQFNRSNLTVYGLSFGIELRY